MNYVVRIILQWALPLLMEQALEAAARLSKKTENTIDDKFVAMMSDNQDNFISEIRTNLKGRKHGSLFKRYR